MTQRLGQATPAQQALVDFLLQRPFEGREEILAILPGLRTVPNCDCGCGSFAAHENGIECTGGDRKLPPEGATFDMRDVNPIDVLLFRCERGVHVEVVDYLDRGAIPLPTPDELTLLP